MSWGIVPEALIGNSVGEYAAAVIVGVMSLGDGLRLVAGRGKLIEKLGGGAMLAVALGEEQLQPLLGEKLSIAIRSEERCWRWRWERSNCSRCWGRSCRSR